ncbi:hypothetical protein [Microtetraspora malaysiensis]|nr:hypothetical protein [Microtetraspora malaysiensis]
MSVVRDLVEGIGGVEVEHVTAREAEHGPLPGGGPGSPARVVAPVAR